VTDDKPKQVVNNSGNDEEHDTVGAVAIDKYGNVAAATSTGGITAKRVGRIGDSPIIGAGGYADDSCGAVSTTGSISSLLLII
jgi:beta-aspartyl-peptidase (threonine type)